MTCSISFFIQVEQVLIEPNQLSADNNNPSGVVFQRLSESEVTGYVYNILVRLSFGQLCNISDNLICIYW